MDAACRLRRESCSRSLKVAGEGGGMVCGLGAGVFFHVFVFQEEPPTATDVGRF